MNDFIPHAVNAMNAIVIKKNNESELANDFQQISSNITSGASSSK